MKYSIHIEYPFENMEKSRKRMNARSNFMYHDRIPVNFCIVPRYFTHVFGIDYCEIFKDAETQYYWLLQFAKCHIENIPSDFCTEPVLYVHPYFDNVITSSAFGAEVVWPKNETLHALPTMKDVNEIETLKIPEPDAELCGRTIQWWNRFKELAKETEIFFNGQRGRVDVAPLTLLGLGPHMTAVDLVGTDFYWWMAEYPEECHRLLGKITEGMSRMEENARKIDSRKRGVFHLAEDSSQIMSDQMFCEFTVPYDKKLYDRFGTGIPDGRGMHMCGNSIHLHNALVEELGISSFNVFGSLVPPEVAAKNMGGKVLLWGNVDPILMRMGTKQEVKNACMHALEAMAPCGGLMLGDGANVCPGTPLENLAALTEASIEYSENALSEKRERG